jgi:hypothetical protein
VRATETVGVRGQRRKRALGQVLFQAGAVAGAPVAVHGGTETHQPVVALGVGLLAQVVDDRIAPVGDLVDPGGDVAQLALGAQLVEEHREVGHDLHDQVEGVGNVRVEQRRDVPLEQIGVADKHTFEVQIDDESRQ